MALVVVLHWLSVMPSWRAGQLVDRNVVEVVPPLWPVTWVGDVMSLFFFVGGYANWVSYADARLRGETVGAYLGRRYRRLLAPTFLFFGVWLGVDLGMVAVGAGAQAPLRHVSIGNTIPFGPLWFLGVYLVVIALSPWTIAAHRRWHAAVPAVMLVAVAGVDAVAFALDTGSPLVANLLLVWLIPHQLGYFYADGTLTKLSTATCVAIAFCGLLALWVLTSLPGYPRCLLCIRWKVMTIDAPSLSLVVAGVWLIGLALSLRRLLERRLSDPRRWRAVSRLNRLTMPVYLWHMTAYLVAAWALGGLGFVWATRATPAWWWGRPVMVGASALALGGILLALRWAQTVTLSTRRKLLR